MNKRQLDIIEKLSSAYRKFNISELADECKVSERTIRKDLDVDSGANIPLVR